jgi:hypothetical protein
MAKTFKSLHFAPMPDERRATDPLKVKREALLKRLTNQKGRLLEGEKFRTEKQKKVRPTWIEHEDGRFTFWLRNFEFQPGMPAIVCKSEKELEEAIDLVIDEVKLKRLDDMLRKAAPGKAGRRKRAA